MKPTKEQAEAIFGRVFSLRFRKLMEAKHGKAMTDRVLAALMEDFLGGRDMSNKRAAYPAFHGKAKYLRIVDAADQEREVKTRSMWLLLRTGQRFRIGKHVVCLTNEAMFIDGRPGQLNDGSRGWLESVFRRTGHKVVPVTKEAEEAMKSFPIFGVRP